MAMVNMNNLLNGKDSRWLQLEVCREFQRNKCTRPDTECKFAHPPANVEVQNGRVTACYDSIKGRCNREKPPCKYFHPPQHLKDQLLINGRNHLALKNALMQQMGLTPGQTLVPGQVPAVATNPYLTGMPQVGSTYSPYFAPGPIMPAIMGPADPTGVGSPLGVVPQTVAVQQKMPRSDRLEMDMKSVGSFYYENFAFPGMVPYKRPAGDKSGMPVYQPSGATTYQQLMQLQQPFVPVSCEYAGTPPIPSLPQTSNQTASGLTAAVNSSLQQSAQGDSTASASSLQSLSDQSNGVLVDPRNPPPPPPGGDKQANSSHDSSDTAVHNNSPELNHSANCSPAAAMAAAAAQLNSLPPSMSPMTSMGSIMTPMSSMAGLTSIANMPSMASMTSLANMTSMANMANMASMAHYTMANINALNNFNAVQNLPMDPAALAKEVAQKNYAKAVKLSASQSQYSINPLTALNYTGVALNKQALSMPPPSLPGTPAPRPNAGLGIHGLAGIPGALTSPLSAGIFHYPRPPPQPTPMSHYSLMRPQMLPGSYMQTMPHLGGIQSIQGNPYAMQNPYAMLPGMAGMPGVSGLPPGVAGVQQHLANANSATIAAQPQVALSSANSGVPVMQPYKKMKTT